MLVFGEPLDSTLDGADAGDLGVTLTRRAGVTLFPFGMVDAVTGVRDQLHDRGVHRPQRR